MIRPLFFTLAFIGLTALAYPHPIHAHSNTTSNQPECHRTEKGGQHCHFQIKPDWKNLEGASVEEMRACFMELRRQCTSAQGGPFCSQSAGRLCRSLGQGRKGG